MSLCMLKPTRRQDQWEYCTCTTPGARLSQAGNTVFIKERLSLKLHKTPDN